MRSAKNETTRATLFARLRHLLDRVLGSRGRDGESAEDRLRQAEAKYRTLVEQLPLVTYIDALTETASAIYASPQVESLLGYTVEEWVGDPGFFPKILGEPLAAYLQDPAECNDATDKSLLPGDPKPEGNSPLRAGVCFTTTTIIHLRSIDAGDPAPSGWSGPIAPMTVNGVTYVTYWFLTPN